METKTVTKEERKQNFEALRKRWKDAKTQCDAGEISVIQAITKTHGLDVSPYSYFFVSAQIKAKGLEGIPYLDYKTYGRWRGNGFQVKKGEKSVIDGISWITPWEKDKEGNDIKEKDYSFPILYHLFGRHQVQEAA